MTTYGFNLRLDEQEFWAIKEAMEFYLSTEAKELRYKNPHLVKFAADIKLHELLSSGKLYKEMQTNSSNNFVHLSRQLSSSVAEEESLFTIVIQQLESNPKLLSLAGTPIRDLFLENPALSKFIRDCIIDCLDNQIPRIRVECKNLLEDDVARELFCSQIGKELYRINSQSRPT